ncbi:MAG TPA: methyltransferase domain-containing protein [Actinomycetota bacterium]|nr:methyltransferase domain-containing protein [Actinomycetota bacterium]
MQADALVGIDKKAVAGRFNRSATFYDAHCHVQRRMADRLMKRLDGLPMPSRILELGCGTGYLTEMLAGRFPEAAIRAVDFAENMVDRARQRLRRWGVELEVADAEAAGLATCAYDLVISNATIQWFDDPASTTAGLAAALRPGGLMLHSTFGPATFAELKQVLAGPAGDPGGVGPPLRGPGEWEALLSGAGLGEVVSDSSSEVVHYPSAGDFLLELQATGATCRPNGAENGPTPPGALRQALAHYDARFGTSEGAPVTYQLLQVSGVRIR